MKNCTKPIRIMMFAFACIMATLTANAQMFPQHLTFQTAKTRNITAMTGQIVKTIYGTELGSDVVSELGSGMYLMYEDGLPAIKLVTENGFILSHDPVSYQGSVKVNPLNDFVKKLRQGAYPLLKLEINDDAQPVHQHRQSMATPTKLHGNANMAMIEDLTEGFVYTGDLDTSFIVEAYWPYLTADKNMRFMSKSGSWMLQCSAESTYLPNDPKGIDTLTDEYAFNPATQVHSLSSIPVTVYYTTVVLRDTTIQGIAIEVVDSASQTNIRITIIPNYKPNLTVSCQARPASWKPHDAEEFNKSVMNDFGPIVETWDTLGANVGAVHGIAPMLNGLLPSPTQGNAYKGIDDPSISVSTKINVLAHADSGGICGLHAELLKETLVDIYHFQATTAMIAKNPFPDGNGHAITIVELFPVPNSISKIYVLDATTNTWPVDSNDVPIDIETAYFMIGQHRQREIFFKKRYMLKPFLSNGPCENLSQGLNVPGVNYVEAPELGKTLYRYYAFTNIEMLAAMKCYKDISLSWQGLVDKGIVYDGDFRDFPILLACIYNLGPDAPQHIVDRMNAALIPLRGVGLR